MITANRCAATMDEDMNLCGRETVDEGEGEI